MIIEKAVEIFIINRLLEENIMNKELISKNYLYVSNAIKEFHFLEYCLFSNYSMFFFLFLEKLASIVPMFQSDYDYNWRLIPVWSVKIL